MMIVYSIRLLKQNFMNFFYAKFSLVPDFDTNIVINQLKYLHKGRWTCNQSVVLETKVFFTDKINEP